MILDLSMKIQRLVAVMNLELLNWSLLINEFNVEYFMNTTTVLVHIHPETAEHGDA